MGAEYLIDTNVIIDYQKGKLPVNGMRLITSLIDDTESFIATSVICKIEVLGFDLNENAQRQMEEFFDAITVINLGDSLVDKTIALKKVKKIKLPDAIIAATALEHNLTLVTRNIADFDIIGLTVINPHAVQ